MIDYVLHGFGRFYQQLCPVEESSADSRRVPYGPPHFARPDTKMQTRPAAPGALLSSLQPPSPIAWQLSQTVAHVLCLLIDRYRCILCRPLTYSLPPVPGVVYSSATLLCPRICTRSMNLMALVATLRLLRIARRSFESGRWPSSFFRISLSLLHIRRTCRTVWRPS